MTSPLPPIGRSPAETQSQPEAAGDLASSRRTRREAVTTLIERLVEAIREGDDDMVERAVLDLSARSRWLAPLALLVSGFVMLFQGVKLLFVNWRLTLVQLLPAMWIWMAMLDLKVHVMKGRGFVTFNEVALIILFLVFVAGTAASFYLNAVFGFAVARKGPPEIRPGFAEAKKHRRIILTWGVGVGCLLGFSVVIADRWGLGWFALSLSVTIGLMMFAYVALPSRLLGLRSDQSRRDKLTASAVGGAVGAIICSPSYILGRVAIIMIGSHVLRYVAFVMLLVAVVLQAGATSAVKAVKMSAKIVAGMESDGQHPGSHVA
jgi:hypothetical protein